VDEWNDGLSNSFSISNGVKQGGILSPVLFCIYYDERLRQLQQSRHSSIGTFSYCNEAITGNL
jgi:hypothetical protein